MQRKCRINYSVAFIFCCLPTISFVQGYTLSNHMKFCGLEFIDENGSGDKYSYKDGCKLYYGNEELTTIKGVGLAKSLDNFKRIINKAWHNMKNSFEKIAPQKKINSGAESNGLVLAYIAWKEFNSFYNGPYFGKLDYDFPGFEYKEFDEQKKYVLTAISELADNGYSISKTNETLANDVTWYLSSPKWYGWYYIKAYIFEDYFGGLQLAKQTCNPLPILREDEFELFPELSMYAMYYKDGSKGHQIELEMAKIAKTKKLEIGKFDDEFILPLKDWKPEKVEKQEKFPEPIPEPIMPLKEDNTVVTNSNAETEATVPAPESEREPIMGTTKAEKTYKDDIEEIGSYEAVKAYQDVFDRWAHSPMSISTMLSNRMQEWKRDWLNQYKLNVRGKYGLNGLTLYVDEIDDKGLYTITIANKKRDNSWWLVDEFLGNDYLKSVTIGKGVTLFASEEHFKNIRLGEERIYFLTRHGPFLECKNLEEVTLPEDLNYIPEKAFSRTALKFIRIPKTVETIERAAFYNALKLEKVEFEAGSKLKNINAWAFRVDDEDNEKSDFVGLKSISIPDSCTFIGEEAFYGQKNLKELTLPSSLKKVHRSAFKNSGIEKLEIKAGLKKIVGGCTFSDDFEGYTYDNSGSNKYHTFFEAVFRLGNRDGKVKKYEKIVIPKSVTKLCNEWSSILFEDIDIENGDIELEDKVFHNITGVKRIHVPNGKKERFQKTIENIKKIANKELEKAERNLENEKKELEEDPEITSEEKKSIEEENDYEYYPVVKAAEEYAEKLNDIQIIDDL